MPARTAAITVTLVLVTHLTATASCPATNGRDAPACDTPVPSKITTALCAADARTSENCADSATRIVHAIYLTRAASEWRKAAVATGRHTTQARRWLAHATILDERVQDDPDVPLQLRRRAAHDEVLAKAALLSH